MKYNTTDFSELEEVLDNPHVYGGYLVSLCPFHSERRPSFFVYPDWYKCLSCGAQGPTNQLLKRLGKIERIISVRAKEYYGSSNPFSGWLRDKTLRQTLKMGWETINNNPGMGNYIVKDRGIDEPYRKLLGIGYLDDWYTIPIRNQRGTIISAIARKGRDNPATSKYVLPYGTDPHLLYFPNLNRVKRAEYLLITFGILDAVVLAMLGEPAASTISGKRLSNLSVARFRIPIMLIPDQHEEIDGLSILPELGWRGVMPSSLRLDWPDGCKDINEIWVKDRNLCREFVRRLTNEISK